ncbi:MAG: hypothetical protein IJL18_02760, partial [Synergistaceae bacterium]|nr:hypothetical protein [Synergistaceae bacterium]
MGGAAGPLKHGVRIVRSGECVVDSGKGTTYIHVFGCRASLSEGEFIAGMLKSYGHDVTEDLTREFSSAVIVTCSVT